MRAPVAVWTVALALAFGASACVIEPVPVDGLRCPCRAPAACDLALNVCVYPGEGICGRPGAPASDLTLEGLRVSYEAANQVLLRWDGIAEHDRVARFEVDVARSEAELGAGAFRIVTHEEGPQLARGSLDRTGSVDLVDRVVVSRLEAATTYFFRVVVVDDGGSVACSRAVSTRTLAPPNVSSWVFDDAPTPSGSLRPDCATLSSDPSRAESGSAYIEHTFSCVGLPGLECDLGGTPAPECWGNIGVIQAGLDVVAEGMTEGQFEDAFLELAAAIDDGEHAYWTEVSVQVGDLCSYQVSRVTMIADGAYHTFQFPLSALRSRRFDRCVVGGEPLEHADLAADRIRSVRVATTLSHDAVLRLDSIRVRW